MKFHNISKMQKSKTDIQERLATPGPCVELQWQAIYFLSVY